MRNQMKDLIADAYVALSRKKSIDKITVKDLVDYCDISRQSFYYHFQDILEVIEYLAQRMERNVSAQCRQAGSLEEAVHIMVSHFVAHYPMLEKLRGSQKREFIERLMMESFQVRLRSGLKEKDPGRPVGLKDADVEAIISFFMCGLAGLMMEHCQKKDPDVDELTRQIMTVLKYLIPELGKEA